MGLRPFIVLTALLSILTGVACGRRSTESRRLNPIQIADRSRPATVTIITEITARVEARELDTDSEHLVGEVRAQFAGTHPGRDQIYAAVLNLFLSNPGKYLVATGNLQSVEKTAASRGSGLVISPDGYVVTNAHVVEPDEDELKAFLIASIGHFVENDIRKVSSAIDRELPGNAITDDARVRLAEALAKQYARNSRLSDRHRTVHALMGYTKHAGSIDIQGIPCEVRKTGKPIPGKDVALLKMEGTDFPTVPVASSLVAAGVRTGAELYVLGYPGAVAVDEAFSLPSRLEPSLTSGHVSGLKDMTDGWKVIQTDAAINPGNSGGPVFNNFGEVVGLATFTIRGTENGPAAQGLNFVVGIDTVNELLDGAAVKPRQSQFTAKYLKALDAYEARNNGHALKLFRELNAERPEIAAVQEFVRQLGGDPTSAPPPVKARRVPAEARPQVKPSPKHRTGNAAVLIGLGVLLVGITLAVVLANRR